METASDNPKTASENPIKRRGRKPRNYTEEEMKERHRRQKVCQSLYRQRMIGISSAYEAWKALKEKGCWSHGELAWHLLDVHSKFCTQPNCISSKTTGRDQPVSSEGIENEETPDGKKRLEKSSNESDPVSDPEAKILASFRPIRKREELQVSGVQNIVKNPENHTNLPKLISCEKDSSTYVNITVGDTQGGVNETFTVKEEKEQQNGEIVEVKEEHVWEEERHGEVETDKDTFVDDVLTFEEKLESGETGSKDEKKKCVNDPDWKEDVGIDIRYNEDEDEDRNSSDDESPREKKQRQDNDFSNLPFHRYDVAEVAKAEGISFAGVNRHRVNKLCWTEMDRTYQCKLCSFEGLNAYNTCRHLLQEHPEVVVDLEEYLLGKPASDSQPGRTLYEMVMESPSPNDSILENNEGSECHDGGEEEESGSAEIKEGESKSSNSGGKETKDNPLDTIESVELLLRWVKLLVSCKFCEKVIKSRLFSQKGEKIVHRCGLSRRTPVLCDVCGKSFPYSCFKTHWTEVHGAPEQTICPYCGKMMKNLTLKSHIVSCHTNKEDEYRCGICRKGFRTKKSRNTHEVIHQKEKPFKCTFCQRGFTQATNMRYHMRQHTGEKPYQCHMCPESFAHNVSLKNHLKSRHGIDPWTDPAWN